MDVILLERVEKLGAIGDVVKVKDGFARNFLLPRKKALRANEANRKVFEANRARIESDNAERRTGAEAASKGIKMDRFIGNWWSANDSDVVPAGDGAKGYKGATFHAPGSNFKVHADIVKHVYDKGKGAGKGKDRHKHPR